MAQAANGTPQSSKLYMPFGGWRWGSGALPTARQFTSADTVMDGLNRYAHAGDSPSTNTDPTGHDWFSDAWNNTVNMVGHALDFVTGFSASISDVQALTGVGEGCARRMWAAYVGAHMAEQVVVDARVHAVNMRR